MLDRPNTRLRTNSLILPPRRLRHSPTPPPRQRLYKVKDDSHSPPPFPPPNIVLHSEDAFNKTLIAIGRAMLSIDNRAITIKDLSQLSISIFPQLWQSPSAASQAITTFIRNHHERCQRDHSKPLLLSLALTGTAADDRLVPALHSRSGGTSSTKEPDRALTCFRRGTTVWYLSEVSGAPCPFKRVGLCLDDLTSTSHGTKRKRESSHTSPRKLPALGPAMATRTRTHTEASTSRLKITLTLKARVPSPPSPSDIESGTESESDINCDVRSNTARAPSISDDDSATDDSSCISDSDSLSQLDDHIPVFSSHLPPYPIVAASIPSPSCTTPGTSLASPSVTFQDPFSPRNSNAALCSSPLGNTSFSSFRAALSNPPQDRRFRSRSLPFSAASPPPDSEDEDDDYHNSMVGLRRGSVPLPLKKEEDDEEDHIPKFEPVTPKCVPGSIFPDWQQNIQKRDHSPEGVSTPLELLPGFVFPPEPEPSSRGAVKVEPTSAVLPPANLSWSDVHVKRENASDDERTVLDPEEAHTQVAWGGKGTPEDPVRIQAVVDDVEVLGPESVRSREWDAAWCSAGAVAEEPEEDQLSDVMEVDDVDAGCIRRPSLERDVFACRELDLRASPAETLATVPTSISSPPSETLMTIDGEHDAPFLMHPLRSCDPPVVATVLEGIPVYHTLLAPSVPLLRRIDTSFVNLTPLMVFLGLPLSALVAHTHAALRISVSRAPEPFGGTWVPLSVAQSVVRQAGTVQVPQGVRDVFLSADLGVWFPDALSRLVQLHGKSAGVRLGPVEALGGIRVEDVFAGTENTEQRIRPEVTLEMFPAPLLSFDAPHPAYAAVPLSLDEQEETLFRSFVDFSVTGASATSSPLSSPPSSPPLAKATVPVTTCSAKEKENAVKADSAPTRRKREKPVEVPVRRSKRTSAIKQSAPVTRSRARGACADGRAHA